MFCGRPGRFRNGYILGKQFSYEGKVVYNCFPGYTLIGDGIRYCTDLGSWWPEKEPICLG